MHYILGLGNPGKEYEDTRHNLGRAIVTHLEEACGGSGWTKDKLAQALRAAVVVGGSEATLALPETYMNRSGETAAYFVRAEGAKPEDIIVVYDEIDLPFGTIRIGKGRGDGGHNGLKSITAALGSKEFIRIRVGIAPTSFWTGKVKRPQGGGALERFVLARFTSREKNTLEQVISEASDAIACILENGVAIAMNRFN